MAIHLYMDHNVPRAITDGLRTREVDIITAFEDGASELDDPELLDRAYELRRVLFTRDYNLLQEATKRQRAGQFFNGLIYAHQLRVSIGTCIRDLEIIAKGGEPEDLVNSVQFLPL
ncbi:hypothetical protein BMS3Bbin06_01499 [bacterium BMS3Bbin06]|nr:hypothetical protein BMS3Bbin06_01499 [bacterium BMS3Bbin06]